MPLLRIKTNGTCTVMGVEAFLSKFDPTEEVDVRWLMQMVDVALDMGGHNLVMEVNKNPMGLQLKDDETLEWPMIHCMLGMKYAKAVFAKTAWIPA